jgi:hypothetical protein
VVQGLDEEVAAQGHGRDVFVAQPPEDDLAAVGNAGSRLVGDAIGVRPLRFDGVEAEAANRVIDVKQVLGVEHYYSGSKDSHTSPERQRRDDPNPEEAPVAGAPRL